MKNSEILKHLKGNALEKQANSADIGHLLDHMAGHPDLTLRKGAV